MKIKMHLNCATSCGILNKLPNLSEHGFIVCKLGIRIGPPLQDS